MTSTDTEERHSDAFVRRITEQCLRDRGRRAALRRGLRRRPEQAYTMHAVVAPLLRPSMRQDQEYAYYAVAAMIAATIRDRPNIGRTDETAEADEAEASPTGDTGRGNRPNLGQSLAWAVCRPGPGRRAMNQATAEKRLHLLVRQGYPGVYQHLAGVVRHLGTVESQVDWAQLLDDLCRWRYYRDQVAKSWLQSFYRTLHDADRRAEKQHHPILEESA
ncbi:type I-E CRISPR-associated protein Cse2/CasB [Micromonospora chalcea]|uniref:type I-E CRISPR-associated protein Cse2/CasB n=1 Tax=Micromonospora chalcea TaxID=1874 RepID=UPI001656BBAF|nr:type I-E CRISPR-associated protein Cse2/CasB [Micromonospora chalcea]MBC8991323.1 type I-E CRISPR-associated protein Cse2/CasB [Micromonospora chalcea]